MRVCDLDFDVRQCRTVVAKTTDDQLIYAALLSNPRNIGLSSAEAHCEPPFFSAYRITPWPVSSFRDNGDLRAMSGSS